MRKLAYVITIVAVAIASFTSGSWWTSRTAGSAAEKARASQVVYSCPMHPQYRQDHPGDCPSCGMRLEPVTADGGAGSASGDRPSIPGTVHVSPERQQTIGVSLGKVERVSGRRTLRTTGRIVPNENATFPLVAGTDGWIRTVREAATGTSVRKNEVLATFSSPEFAPTLQSYYATLDAVQHTAAPAAGYSPLPNNLARYADQLRNLGVSEIQLEEMRQSRQLSLDVQIVSPVDGFIVARNAAAGLRFERGFEWYRVADLRRVWILADLYDYQVRFIRAGELARVSSGQRTYAAVISRAQPTFDETTRTLKVRLETDNPGFVLKPGMFADIEFDIDLPPALTVPADAIVDSGLRRIVFVERGDGYFEPRQVETGWRIGGQVEIIKGLMADERIVIAGTFLVDSESRMKAAAAGIFTTAVKDVVCGMDVDEKKAAAAGKTATHDGHAYYFCSDDCRKKFEADPASYLGGEHSRGTPPAAGAGRAAATLKGTAPMPPEYQR